MITLPSLTLWLGVAGLLLLGGALTVPLGWLADWAAGITSSLIDRWTFRGDPFSHVDQAPAPGGQPAWSGPPPELARLNEPRRKAYRPCQEPAGHGPQLAGAAVDCPEPPHWEAPPSRTVPAYRAPEPDTAAGFFDVPGLGRVPLGLTETGERRAVPEDSWPAPAAPSLAKQDDDTTSWHWGPGDQLSPPPPAARLAAAWPELARHLTPLSRKADRNG